MQRERIALEGVGELCKICPATDIPMGIWRKFLGFSSRKKRTGRLSESERGKRIENWWASFVLMLLQLSNMLYIQADVFWTMIRLPNFIHGRCYCRIVCLYLTVILAVHCRHIGLQFKFHWKNRIFSQTYLFLSTAVTHPSSTFRTMPPFEWLRHAYDEISIIIYHFYLWSRFSQSQLLDDITEPFFSVHSHLSSLMQLGKILLHIQESVLSQLFSCYKRNGWVSQISLLDPEIIYFFMKNMKFLE